MASLVVLSFQYLLGDKESIIFGFREEGRDGPHFNCSKPCLLFRAFHRYLLEKALSLKRQSKRLLENDSSLGWDKLLLELEDRRRLEGKHGFLRI
jgi:hypothetical protein